LQHCCLYSVQARVKNNVIIGNIQSEVAKDNFISLYQPKPVKESCKSEHDTPTIWAIGSDCGPEIMANSFMKETKAAAPKRKVK
jgi:hypothetical protein